MRAVFLVLLLIFSLAPSNAAFAHAFEPGFLEMEPLGEGEWRITWRKPEVAGRPMAIDAVLPSGCSPRRGPEPGFDGRAYIASWIARCDAPIWEGELFIDGLRDTTTDVLVRYTPEQGASAQTLRLFPGEDRTALPAVPTPWRVLSGYFALGFDHILGGIDHLLFVLALLLLITDVRKLIVAVTAFTIAHSITLAAATLGWVSLPVPPVEAVIALSIVFLASEIVARHEGPPTLLQRAPWIVAFAFGLLHGFGFASALREIGLPEGDVPLALLAFNLGVEAGQLVFVAAVLLLAGLLRLVAPGFLQRQLSPRAPGKIAAGYAIGSLAAFWTIERVASFAA
jgi:hydrogenase/urease accessory protein HupE